MTLRIGLYSHWDLEDPQAWSGVARSMADALHEVLDVEVIPPVTIRDAATERARTRLRGARGRHSLPRHTMATAQRRSAMLARHLVTRTGPPLDALVTIAASTDVLAVPTGLPLIQITDATFPAIRDFYPLATGLGPRGEREGDRVERAGAAVTDRYVVASRWAADSLLQDVGVPAGHVVVAPFGPGIPGPETPRVRRPNGALRVLAVMADWDRKRGGLVIEAVHRARASSHVELTVVGRAPEDIPAWVHREGVVPRARLTELYATHDVLVDLASANAAGVVMTDALVSGLPVIATKVGGVSDIVRDGATGWLVDPRDPVQPVADLLTRLMPDQIAEASRRAIDDARRRLSWRSWAGTVKHAVRDAVQDSVPPRAASRRVVMISPILPSRTSQEAAGEKLVREVADVLETDAELWLVSTPGPANRRAIARGGVPRFVFVEPPADRVYRALDLRPVSSRRGLTAVRDLVRRADVLDIQWEENGLLIPALRGMNPRARLVVTLHDVLSQRFARQRDLQPQPVRKAVWETRRRAALALERLILTRADHVVVLSDKDAALLPLCPSRARVHVVPPPIPGALRPEREDLTPQPAPRLLFVGFMARWPNEEGMHWFVTEVLPLVRAEVPGVRMAVAGGGLRDHVVEELSATGVEVLGFVDDLEGLYDRADAVVVPLLSGAGVKFKVVEALVRGVPVVTTTVGNEGISPVDGAYVADTPEDFARAVVRVLRDPAVAERRARAAAPKAAAEFGPARFRERLQEVYG